jgi:hypothetical protein
MLINLGKCPVFERLGEERRSLCLRWCAPARTDILGRKTLAKETTNPQSMSLKADDCRMKGRRKIGEAQKDESHDQRSGRLFCQQFCCISAHKFFINRDETLDVDALPTVSGHPDLCML